MQTNKITEHELVKMCMAELCQKEGFADCDNLVQREQQFLCDRIEAETGVMISLSTIKRLLNGQFSRIPQIATLDAIAISAGYKNWQNFRLSKNQNGINHHEADSAENLVQAINPGNKILMARLLVFAMGLILVAMVFLIVRKSGEPVVGNADKAQFSATKVTGNDIPNTVVFKYNVDSVNADSFFIQQSWDKNRRVKIQKHNYTLTDIYYEPGFHTAKLIANNKVIKKLYVSIPTDRWFFYTKENVPKSIPKYIPTTGFKDGAMQLTPGDILNSKTDIKKDNQICQVYFPSKIGNSSDNFVLKFRIKVNSLNNEACPYFMSEVFCQRYFMYFKSSLKGCTSTLDCEFGEYALNGKINDLSAFGSNVNSWQNVEFMVKDKNATISINGVRIFSAPYHHSAGLITGLGFISNGLCQVDFVDFKTIDGKNIYSNNFNK
jgi:hypothetical protein